jgi:hypothetical protein
MRSYYLALIVLCALLCSVCQAQTARTSVSQNRASANQPQFTFNRLFGSTFSLPNTLPSFNLDFNRPLTGSPVFLDPSTYKYQYLQGFGYRGR